MDFRDALNRFLQKHALHVNLAAMRAVVARVDGDPQRVNPVVQVDLVSDYSVQALRQGLGA